MAEVVGDVEVGQPVAGEVGARDGQGPTGGVLVRDRVLVLGVLRRRMRAGGAAVPLEDVVAAGVLGVGEGVVHRHVDQSVRVEDVGVREVVPDDDRGVAAAVEVADVVRVGVPARSVVLAVRRGRGYQLLRHVGGGGERRGARLGHEQDRGPAPVGDQQVRPAVAVEVARGAAGRRHGVVHRQRCRVEDEGGEPVGGAGGRRIGDHDVVGPGVDDAHGVGQTVAGEVVDGDARPDRGDPGLDLLVRRIHDPDGIHVLLVVTGRHGDGHFLEAVLRCRLDRTRRLGDGDPDGKEERGHDQYRHQTRYQSANSFAVRHSIPLSARE